MLPRIGRTTRPAGAPRSSIHSGVEQPFGYLQVRYRGLAKNAAQVLTLFTVLNLWMARRQLLPATRA